MSSGKKILFPRAARVLSVVAVMALVATACGTRVDREAFTRSLEQVGGTAPGPALGSEGELPQAIAERPAPGQIAPSSNEVAAGQAPDEPPRPSVDLSREPVGDVIPVGMHVPITGAAPLPTDWMATVAAIEEYLNTEGRIHGRGVRFMVEDDGYEPARGSAACRKLADANPLFVIGHTMPGVQDACARIFNDRGIPYLMRGTYEAILEGRPYAYFGTISDDRQGALLADYTLGHLEGRTRKSAVIYQDDQVAAKERFVTGIRDGGGSVVVEETTVPRQADFASVIQKLRQAGAENVFLSMPPVDAIKISVQSQAEGYRPTWLGGATYWNYNMSVESAGMALDGAISFSAWPTIDSAAADPFREVFRKYRATTQPEDLGLIIWGWTMLVRTALEAVGPDLHRASFAEALNGLRFSEPYWHPVAYTPEDRRGASSVAVLRADGRAKVWRQITGFVSEF